MYAKEFFCVCQATFRFDFVYLPCCGLLLGFDLYFHWFYDEFFHVASVELCVSQRFDFSREPNLLLLAIQSQISFLTHPALSSVVVTHGLSLEG